MRTDKGSKAADRPLLICRMKPKGGAKIFRRLFLVGFAGVALALWGYSLAVNIISRNFENIIQCGGLLFAIGVFVLILYLSVANKWSSFLRFAKKIGNKTAQDIAVPKKQSPQKDYFAIYADYIIFCENGVTEKVLLRDLAKVSVFKYQAGTCDIKFYQTVYGGGRKPTYNTVEFFDMQMMHKIGSLRELLPCDISVFDMASDYETLSNDEGGANRNKIFTKEKMLNIIMPIVAAAIGAGMIAGHHFLLQAQPGRTELMPMLFMGIAFAAVGVLLTLMILLPDESGKKGTFFGGLMFTVFPLMMFFAMANEAGTLNPLKVIEIFPFTLFFLIFVLFGLFALVTSLWYIIAFFVKKSRARKNKK